jgi:uncharacterized repeat protein (TIGR03803 family)
MTVRSFRISAIAVTLLLSVSMAHAQTLTTLHSFTNGPDGSYPLAGLTMDRGGNLYGTTTTSGLQNHCAPFGCGTVFKMSYRNSAWLFSTLYSFQGGNDGATPTARVVIGPDGALYGTTIYGGGQGDCHGNNPHCGTVFKLQPPPGICRDVLCPWAETILYSFQGGADGADPEGDIIFDAAGNIYGTTANGGSFVGDYCQVNGCGVVYELSPSSGGWTETVLHAFMGGTDGWAPNGGVIRDAAGNLYGTTSEGGSTCAGSGCGTVFELSPSQGGWTETVLYSFLFDDPNGDYPDAGLTMGSAGHIYGATTTNGTAGGGTIFELASNGASWTFSTIYDLVGTFGGGPVGALTLDASGDLYGAARYDGANNVGSIFKLTPSNGSWAYTDIYDFSPPNESGWLYDGLVLGPQGTIFGTSYHGGTFNYGEVFEIMQ